MPCDIDSPMPKQVSTCDIDSFMEKQLAFLEHDYPTTVVEEVPGVRFIQLMNEMGYFIAIFDIEEPIVYTVTFENDEEVRLGHH